MTEEKGTAFTLQMVTLFCGVDDHMEITVCFQQEFLKTVFSCIHLKIDTNKEGFLGVC